jgi:hypothetical protein
MEAFNTEQDSKCVPFMAAQKSSRRAPGLAWPLEPNSVIGGGRKEGYRRRRRRSNAVEAVRPLTSGTHPW